jgi:hypothetical protein
MSAGFVRIFKQSGQILLSFGNGIPFSATLQEEQGVIRPLSPFQISIHNILP